MHEPEMRATENTDQERRGITGRGGGGGGNGIPAPAVFTKPPPPTKTSFLLMAWD
jgi:hypothetical protein